MAEIDITQYLAKDKPGDLCRLRGHPNQRTTKINGIPAGLFSRDHCSWPLTYSLECPDCGNEWETVWHNTANVRITGDKANA